METHQINIIEEVELLYNNPLQNPQRGDTYHFCPKESYQIKYIVLEYNKEEDKLYVAKNGAKYIFTLVDFKVILQSVPSGCLFYRTEQTEPIKTPEIKSSRKISAKKLRLLKK